MAYIKAISSYLPEKILTNEKLVEEFPEWTVDKIADKIGVKVRHIAGDDETALEMAVKAAEHLFCENNEIQREDIDFVLFCTQSPDFFLPTSACIIQERLGLGTNTGAIDFNLGCSGYIYGLSLAKGLIAGGIAKNILLLTAETYSKYLHPKDKGNRTIFGDAATATVISIHGFAEIGEFALGTDGRGAENLIVRNGASRNKSISNQVDFDRNKNPVSPDFLFMNGSEIFSFTQRNVPKIVKATIQKNNLRSEDIDLYVFHQANAYMLDFLRKKMNISSENYLVCMEETGNTVSNSIPLALTYAQKEDRLQGNILLCGFGVGYSWGGCIIKIKK